MTLHKIRPDVDIAQPVPVVRLSLEDESLRRLARMVALELAAMTPTANTTSEAGWLDSKAAAAYLGFTSTHPLHKLTARREIPFSRDAAGGKTWFRRKDLDAYRLQGRIEARRDRC